MNMSLKMQKVQENSESLVASEREAEELLTKYSAQAYLPFSKYLNDHNVALAASLLDQMLPLKLEGRQAVCRVCDVLLTDNDAWALSIKSLCKRAELDERTWRSYAHRYPAIWQFINLVVVRTTDLTHEGRVHMAAADAALHGGHQDRRLYLELTNKISRSGGQRSSAGVNIIFVQDTMDRPEPKEIIIEAESSGVLRSPDTEESTES